MPKGFPKRGDELMPLEGGGSGSGMGGSSRSDPFRKLLGAGLVGGATVQGSVMYDLDKSKKENAEKVREINSRAQYEHEKEAGDPNAIKLSFEEWKKL